MSKISEAYDKLLSELVATFPAKVQLPNAIDIDQNSDGLIKKGFAIRLGPAINSNRNLSCKMSLIRDVVIILTLEAFANELRTDERYASIKALLEEHFLLIKRFESNPVLDATASISNFNYSSDAGIQQVINESNQYFKIETLFKMEYFEDLN